MRFSLNRFLVAGLIAFFATSMFAQATRTYVKSTGSDSNTATFCSDPLNPCRHFQNAHDNTAAGGEILVLDPGFYGPLNITKAIHVVAPAGFTAGIIAAASSAGVTINAGSTDIVQLHNIYIASGGNPGTTGVLVTGGGRAEMKGLLIHGCKYGIRAQSDGTHLMIQNTRITEFTDGAGGGIGIWSNSQTNVTGTSLMRIAVTDTSLVGGDTGVKVDGGGFMMKDADRNYIWYAGTALYNISANAFANCTSVFFGGGPDQDFSAAQVGSPGNGTAHCAP